MLERLNCWFSEEAGWGVREVMGRDWWGRGVYWQTIGEMSAVWSRLCLTLKSQVETRRVTRSGGCTREHQCYRSGSGNVGS